MNTKKQRFSNPEHKNYILGFLSLQLQQKICNFKRIQIIFGFEKSPEYEYYSVWKYFENTNITIWSQPFE